VIPTPMLSGAHENVSIKAIALTNNRSMISPLGCSQGKIYTATQRGVAATCFDVSMELRGVWQKKAKGFRLRRSSGLAGLGQHSNPVRVIAFNTAQWVVP
jgi:hypothetical protein